MRALIDRLARLDSCAVSDALDSAALPPAIGGLQALSVQRRIAGRVITVKLGPDAPKTDSRRHLCTAAIEAAAAGDIIVIEHSSGIECAGWGGVLSSGALVKGVAGVIIDGPARDIDEARALDFPVYAAAASARTARGRVYEQDFNCPISVAGTHVDAGDFALADSSGVAFIPADRLEAIVERAERIMGRERLMVDALKKGEPITEVVGRDYEAMLDELD